MKTFEELELISPLRKALVNLDYNVPTAIQGKAIPPALEGRDVLGCAQTGTGKTAAFALPILNRLGKQPRKSRPRKPSVLVLAPTRELAVQIDESFAAYGQHLKLRRALVYGGVSQQRQVRALQRGVHILVATPGRLIDLMEQGHVNLQHLEFFVLDEVDRMLDMGFLPDLEKIIDEIPEERQSLFFSATLPPNIKELANSLLSQPVRVNVTPKSPSVARIKQRVMFVDRGEKREQLLGLLNTPDVERTIVFTKTKRQANQLARQLGNAGVPAEAIHGDKSQNARQRALNAFQDRKVDVLVATDVASRGIDIDGVSHVINYDIPIEPESYVHRIGRTGRAGCAGVAFSFCTHQERRALRAIEKLIGKQLHVVGEDRARSKSNSRSTARNSESRKKRNGKSNGEKVFLKKDKPKRKSRPGKNARRRSKQTVA